MAPPTAAIPHDLLLDLYAGVADSTRWQGMLDRVCIDLGVRSAVVQRIQPLGPGGLATRWVVRDSYSDDRRSLHDEVVGDAVNPRMRGDFPQGVPPQPVMRDSDNPRMAGERGRRFHAALRSVGLGQYLGGGALRAVVDRMRYGVVVCDARGRVVWTSERAPRIIRV